MPPCCGYGISSSVCQERIDSMKEFIYVETLVVVWDDEEGSLEDKMKQMVFVSSKEDVMGLTSLMKVTSKLQGNPTQVIRHISILKKFRTMVIVVVVNITYHTRVVCAKGLVLGMELDGKLKITTFSRGSSSNVCI